MQTWWPNLKKCSIAEISGLIVLLTLTAARLAHAATVKPMSLPPSPRELLNQISSSTVAGAFEPLLGHWQKRYGSSAVAPLLKIAASANPDTQRYVALMGAARLGGKPIAPSVAGFLKDSSWLLRSGALRALEVLREPATAPAVLKLLGDPSLAVRLEAVKAVAVLKPAGAADALVQALGSEDNYRDGKALWVPGRALAALAALHASQSARSLSPLLDHARDPDLQLETVATLERLTGRTLRPGAPLAVRVHEWKLALNSR